MKANRTLSTKRLPVRKGVFKRLHAVTNGKKQRVAATATAGDLESTEAGRKITTGLVVIVAVHVVAIALFFIHHRYIENRAPETAVPSTPAVSAVAGARTPAVVENLPRFAPGELSYRVEAGDTYAKIAEKQGVDQAALQEANGHIPLRIGLSLRMPPKTIVARVPEEITELRANAPSSDRGRVEPAPSDVTAGAPKAKLVKAVPTDKTASAANRSTAAAAPAARDAEAAAPKTGGRSYTVQKGDNLWKISKRLKIDQDKLMKANGIEDARKLQVGMTLVVPN
jgi:LysM repeat protein